MLWPEKSMEEARKSLLNPLNSEHSNKLSPEQIDLLFELENKENCHVVMKYLGDRFSYKFIPIEPKDELAELQKNYIDAAKSIRSISERIERVQAREAS